ncbi:hypothetical protein Q8A67_019274 [Cirrhinus molitorella]|uniref:Uncharacterized protein n=1 Tax=Cirrhinus molitorella TaxID=172907 RepID=A0AA88PAF3_9TELE|nr:hypothetical protein Q8A67_019274 [Cirrhinus molitorella]
MKQTKASGYVCTRSQQGSLDLVISMQRASCHPTLPPLPNPSLLNPLKHPPHPAGPGPASHLLPSPAGPVLHPAPIYNSIKAGCPPIPPRSSLRCKDQ